MMKPGIDFPGVGSGLVIERDGKVLLYKRVKPPEAGHWNIVGGKVDHMETAATAAKREAEEETGLTIGGVRFLCISEQIIPADGQHWLSIIYIADDIKGEPSLTEPDKLSDMGWFDMDALPQPLSLFAQDAFHHLRKSRA
ncbi:NUDIX hydrolase [Agrobacterium rubi]|uniref:NUDIX domain-containing protein n=1 Tax=Agrobacterium rubi TaxID=28099 RepID=A0AAE7R631_9HYPH|nr:NUDIX domain-containing protein [Agrobacterium rubi]NTE86551.1 NUDIX domain-containing protein [Agrobacterium rubi]NTF02483.1 NUDIX domain-containing protein [Agrobacterium rubi]NTF36728.1 NUDIX domain-containing protein [Agrobacterium rubi]OCJ55647.1 DNA mismatch repair protein MutT [Agrobacterium rubi]QTF99180.1 NUDIX domain-containing protein [Agrobacterium rubi]